MEHQFKRIRYRDLNARQQEAYNLQKVGAVLADFGFITIPLSSDWGGADFIAQHRDGKTHLRVQLKSRLTFDKKYFGKDLSVCFPSRSSWFLYPHDRLLGELFDLGLIKNSASWTQQGHYSYSTLSKKVRSVLDAYCLPASDGAV